MGDPARGRMGTSGFLFLCSLSDSEESQVLVVCGLLFYL